MAFVRPHVLAIFCFVLLNVGILRRSRWITALGAALFVLSYHALYVPVLTLLIVALLAFAGARDDRRGLLALAGAGLAGVLVGIVANPYFPGALEMTWIHIRIPFLLAGELRGAGFSRAGTVRW